MRRAAALIAATLAMSALSACNGGGAGDAGSGEDNVEAAADEALKGIGADVTPASAAPTNPGEAEASESATPSAAATDAPTEAPTRQSSPRPAPTPAAGQPADSRP